METTPRELRAVLAQGNRVTLMVWADLDHDQADGDALKENFWRECERQGVSRAEFETIVFAFAKDRLENWIQFLNEGATDEKVEGPRVKFDREVGNAAKKLAKMCLRGADGESLPKSLQWSCKNWRRLVGWIVTFRFFFQGHFVFRASASHSGRGRVGVPPGRSRGGGRPSPC